MLCLSAHLGTQECRHHFAALAIVQNTKQRRAKEGKEDATLAELHSNCAAPKEENTSNTGVQLDRSRSEGQQQLISHVPVSCVTLKNTKKRSNPGTLNMTKTKFGWVTPSQSPEKKNLVDLETNSTKPTTSTSKKKRKIIVSIPEDIAL